MYIYFGNKQFWPEDDCRITGPDRGPCGFASVGGGGGYSSVILPLSTGREVEGRRRQIRQDRQNAVQTAVRFARPESDDRSEVERAEHRGFAVPARAPANDHAAHTAGRQRFAQPVVAFGRLR